MARYWLGPWVWGLARSNNSGGSYGWLAPADAVASLDLRSEPQSAATVTPNGFGLFVTPNATDLGSDYTNLGTDPLATWTQQNLNRWKSALNLPSTLAANNLREVVWETLTIQSDPTGLDRARPIVPTAGRPNYELWLAGSLVKQKRFDLSDPEATPLIDQLKRIYRSIRQDSIDGKHRDVFGNVDLNHYRKILGHWVRKYRINYRNFQPADLPDESDIEPTTTITEDFNTADQNTLGPDLTWYSYAGTNAWQVSSNRAVRPGGAADYATSARAESDLSSSDHYVQAECYGTNYPGVCARFSSSASTYYASDVSNTTIYLYRLSSGTYADITSVANTKVDGQVVKLHCNGSTIKCYYNGAEKISVTNTVIAGNTRGGICCYFATWASNSDNFEAADLAAAAAGGPIFRGRSLGRGRIFGGSALSC